jgi:hypothetical protein
MQRSEVPEFIRVPDSGAGHAAVQEQLERILSSPMFRNSKRYPNLLRHIVERALAGRASELKERALGVEVFGRSADYDTNVDPVVRITAAEIRKRIAQYYHEPGHEEELRIDLPLGSYVPEFRLAAIKPEPAPPVPEMPPPAVPTPAPPELPQPSASPWKAVSGLLAVALALLTLVWARPWQRPSALDSFWAPVLSPGKPVLLCIGRVHDPDGRPHGVALSDATTLARLSGLLQADGSGFTVRAEDIATFDDLRDGPAVMIGAFNDSWSLRLANSGRFTLHQEGGTDWIQDQQNPGLRRWSVSVPGRGSAAEMKEDFGLITRVVDPATDRNFVMVGGLWGYGTLAAGQFVTEAKYLDAFAKQAPAGWQKKNLQIVISTEVIRGDSGPPTVQAFYAW